MSTPMRIQVLLFSVLCLFSSLQTIAAERFGIIEIGSSGLRALTCTVTKNAVGVPFCQPDQRSDPKVEVLAQWKDGKFQGPGYEQALARIQEVVKEMLDSGIPNDSIYMYISSGLDAAAGNDRVSKDATATTPESPSPALLQLRKDIKVKLARQIDFLTVAEEAEFGYRGNFRAKEYENTSNYLVDIGGGNTKGSLLAIDPQTLKPTIDPQTLKPKLISQPLGDGVRTITTNKDEAAVVKAVADIKSAIYTQRQNAKSTAGKTYVVGGIPFIVASWSEAKFPQGSGNTVNEILVTKSQIQEFIDTVAPNGQPLENGKQILFDALIDGFVDKSSPVLESLEKAKDVPYTPIQLYRGARILLGIAESANDGNVVFLRNSLYSIPLEYCASKVAADTSLSNAINENKKSIEKKLDDSSEILNKKLDTLLKERDNLRSEVETLKKSLSETNVRVGKLETSNATLVASVDNLNREIKRLEALIGKLKPIPGTPSDPPSPSDRVTAARFLSEAIYKKRRGDIEGALHELETALTHSVMEADIWFFQAILAYETGNLGLYDHSISQAAELIHKGKFASARVARMLESIQGSSRVAAETQLLGARTQLAINTRQTSQR